MIKPIETTFVDGVNEADKATEPDRWVDDAFEEFWYVYVAASPSSKEVVIDEWDERLAAFFDRKFATNGSDFVVSILENQRLFEKSKGPPMFQFLKIIIRNTSVFQTIRKVGVVRSVAISRLASDGVSTLRGRTR